MTKPVAKIEISRQEVEALATVLNAANEEFELSKEDTEEDAECEDSILICLDFVRRAIDEISNAFPA